MKLYLNNQATVFFFLLLVIVSLLYSSTFHAPFNFDDEAVVKFEIAQNQARLWFEGFIPLAIVTYSIQALSSITHTEDYIHSATTWSILPFIFSLQSSFSSLLQSLLRKDFH